MWVRLKKEIDGGSVSFVLPDTKKKLSFNNGDKLNCRLPDGRELKLEVFHFYIPYEVVGSDNIVTQLERKVPQVKEENGRLYELDLIGVDREEVQKYVGN